MYPKKGPTPNPFPAEPSLSNGNQASMLVLWAAAPGELAGRVKMEAGFSYELLLPSPHGVTTRRTVTNVFTSDRISDPTRESKLSHPLSENSTVTSCSSTLNGHTAHCALRTRRSDLGLQTFTKDVQLHLSGEANGRTRWMRGRLIAQPLGCLRFDRDSNYWSHCPRCFLC
jgi:hypothetical protein